MEFTKEDFVQSLSNYIIMKKEVAAIRSLNDDFTCIINTYLSKAKHSSTKISPENNIDCPFGDLGLIDVLGKSSSNTIYKKSIPGVNSINPWIVLAFIYEEAKSETEIGLNSLLISPCNIGKVFNLDSITLIESLHRAEKTGLVKIVRTAGLDYIKLKEGYSFIDCVIKYYEEIVQ